MKHQIASLIRDTLKDFGFPDMTVDVSTAEEASHGDYTTNVAMKVWPTLKASNIPLVTSPKLLLKSPMDLALQVKEAISKQLSANSQRGGDQNIVKRGQKQSSKIAHQDILSAIDRVEAAPPGFINVFLSEASLITSLDRLLKSGESAKTGQVSSVTRQVSSKVQDMTHDTLTHDTHAKRIMVEFAHPNTHKAFHIGHLRNITTGESIIRLLESQGHDVIRVNYQGDVGMHIAKCLYGILHVKSQKSKVKSWKDARTLAIQARVEYLGEMYAAGSKAFEEDAAAKEEIGYYNALIYAAAQRLAREKGIDPGTTDYLAFVKEDYKDRLETVYALWKETRQWSLDYFETIYQRVGTRYDRYYFESECLAGVDLAREAVKKGVLKEDEGAVILDGKPYGIDTRVFINSKGLPTYEGKELKLATMESSEHGKLDRMIHVVGPEQASFFTITFKAEELLGIVKPGVQYHLVYGWVKLKHGKMSSRSGNVVLGEWLLDEAKKSIYTILDKSDVKDDISVSSQSSPLSSQRTLGSSVKTISSLDSRVRGNDSREGYSHAEKELIAEKAAVAAVKYAFLRVGTLSEIAFDLETSVSFDGDSGPYLQYTYARCKSVLRKAQEAGGKYLVSSIKDHYSLNTKYLTLAPSLNAEERTVLRLLTFFPDVVSEAANNLSPSTLCTYLFKLAAAYNVFYAKHTILGSKQSVDGSKGNDEHSLSTNYPSTSSGSRAESRDLLPATASLRLSLTAATAQELQHGLYLLGIQTMEQM